MEKKKRIKVDEKLVLCKSVLTLINRLIFQLFNVLLQDESLHSQEEVVICLEEHLEENENALTPECDQQITRLAELSADDFHLDRHIYVNCKHDREVFCAEVS